MIEQGDHNGVASITFDVLVISFVSLERLLFVVSTCHEHDFNHVQVDDLEKVPPNNNGRSAAYSLRPFPASTLLRALFLMSI